MRGRFYVWSDGEYMHLWVQDAADDDSQACRGAEYGPAGIKIPLEIFNEIVTEHMRRRLEKA